jgi:hypothetical protein
MWNLTKRISKGDYYYTYLPEHPSSTKNGYVLEHRAIFENSIGRILLADEVIHHKNKNKKDNDIENLELTTNVEHSILHGKEKLRKIAVLKCPWCGKIFEKFKNKTFLDKGGKYTACSRKCNGKISTSSDEKIKQNIQNNLVNIYVGKLQ